MMTKKNYQFVLTCLYAGIVFEDANIFIVNTSFIISFMIVGYFDAAGICLMLFQFAKIFSF